MSAATNAAWKAANPERTLEIQRASYHHNIEARRRSKNEWNKREYAKRRYVLNQIKLLSGCTDCGYRAHPAALDFDHVRGEKLFGVGRQIMAHTWDQTMAEIEKCEVVCANCHRIRTVKRHRDRCRIDGAGVVPVTIGAAPA